MVKKQGMRRVVVALIVGAAFGFLVGISFSTLSSKKLNIVSSVIWGCSNVGNQATSDSYPSHLRRDALFQHIADTGTTDPSNLICEPCSNNPSGAEKLPPRIVANESDLFLHRLWGKPSEDLTHIPKYLVTFTVGINQKHNIDAAVKKFSEDFTILLFHYDGNTSEWDEFEWSRKAIHVSARKQTKWWYAKRFLHPNIVAPYDYIFIWDEDLGLEHFDAEEYIRLVKKHGLEISQPALDRTSAHTWEMTRRKPEEEVHKKAEEKSGWCSNPPRPPCAAFVEIMAPVFSWDAWRCVWHMIQNDLVHGWGLDFALHNCVEPAHEKIGVVDAQWIVHQYIPSLKDQGESVDGKTPSEAVHQRCMTEWEMFKNRLADAEKAYKLQLKGYM